MRPTAINELLALEGNIRDELDDSPWANSLLAT
eukprot:CAMPEP_0179144926 /NCGR_PEP_ID=MMETSP0796-20121207/69878_1 /TAXON_ID=73915 /ORGANISM="Pyrodinium bahamense, Strain pbaha01" /LENGTH=32 /DNA_ID= /DNA_START= /DNA_END= /DNA_ORIENTATION=